jgi:hypothetical protein
MVSSMSSRLPRPDPEFTEWTALRVAEQEEIQARHSPGADGCCVACAAVGLQYHRSPATWPCGVYKEASRLIEMLAGGRR